MLKKFKLSRSIDRLQEEKLYEIVAIEIASENINTGVWAKAQAFSDGCDNRAKSLYIRYRVQSIVDSGVVLEFISEREKTTIHDLVDLNIPDKKQNNAKCSDSNFTDELNVNSFKTEKSTKKAVISGDITITEDGLYKCGDYEFKVLENAKNYSRKLSEKPSAPFNTLNKVTDIENSSSQLQKSDDFHEKYVPIEYFANLKNITINKAILMIKDGICVGRIKRGQWYVSLSEIKDIEASKSIPDFNNDSASNNKTLIWVIFWVICFMILVGISS